MFACREKNTKNLWVQDSTVDSSTDSEVIAAPFKFLEDTCTIYLI